MAALNIFFVKGLYDQIQEMVVKLEDVNVRLARVETSLNDLRQTSYNYQTLSDLNHLTVRVKLSIPARDEINLLNVTSLKLIHLESLGLLYKTSAPSSTQPSESSL